MGRLQVIKETFPQFTPSNRKIRRYICKCDCGKNVIVQAWHLKSGHTKSCGCAHTRHGMCESSEYNIWHGMLNRCKNPKDPRYKDYGGRGIKVCKRWLKFENFFKDMEKRPKGKSIDRIDVDGNYELSNCRWATSQEQQNNTRKNVFLTFNGKTQTISQWAREIVIKRNTLSYRLKRGWSVERALTTK